MTIRDITPADGDALIEFFGALTIGDLTFIREDCDDHAGIREIAANPGMRWIDVDGDGRINGYIAILRLPGWSDHVGELRLVVHPDRRGGGVGRRLAQHAVTAALEAGVRKVTVELAADQESALTLFLNLGFNGEALLRNHIRDRDGSIRDLVVLAHQADEGHDALVVTGLADELHN